MNEVDVKKCFRGVLLNREDVIKCAKCEKRPLSAVVRELLQKAMSKFTLPEDGKKMLASQIEAALEARKAKKEARKSKRVLTVDKIRIPVSVRKNAKFVRG